MLARIDMCSWSNACRAGRGASWQGYSQCAESQQRQRANVASSACCGVHHINARARQALAGGAAGRGQGRQRRLHLQAVGLAHGASRGLELMANGTTKRYASSQGT